MFRPIALMLLLTGLLGNALSAADAPSRPNILWLTTEDIGPHLKCYGFDYADTPNLDAFAAKSLRYRTAWSNAPVCAPARTTIITGVYPPATGAEHMRSSVRMSDQIRMYPQILREAGYYCTNNVKEDYNLIKPGQVWDESSAKAHYKNRPAGKPFFAVFNNTITHESQLRKRPHKAVHDPAKVPLPAYHPDTPEARQDWAQYHDNITTMDAWFGEKLKELAEAGLADDTIVFFYGDHGSGMPRNKRTPCNSGLSVPFIVHVPEKWKHLASPEYMAGAITDRLVSFVDLAPTLCSLTGAKIPEWMQGSAFMGPAAAKPREYVFGFRGRMDERMDLVRSCRDSRYVYVRNFMPHRPHGQHNNYMFQTPTTRVWKKLFDEGKLNDAQSQYWKPKVAEELYDLQADPYEVKNLAMSPEHQSTLARMRKTLHDWQLEIRDVALNPEGLMHERAAYATPYDFGQDKQKYPIERILETAEWASDAGNEANTQKLMDRIADADPTVRYWVATGLLVRGQTAGKTMVPALTALLADKSPLVRIQAAETLVRFGPKDQTAAALDVLMSLANLNQNGQFTAVAALTAIDECGTAAAPLKDKLAALPTNNANVPGSMKEYTPRLLDFIGERLGFQIKEDKQPAKRGARKAG